jgi:hypothetical protein
MASLPDYGSRSTRDRRLHYFSTTGEDSGGLVRTPEEWFHAGKHLAIKGL